MRNILIIALLFAGMSSLMAKDKKPKVDMKDDTVTLDDKALFILDPIKKPKFEAKDYYLKDLSGKKLAIIQSDCYSDPTRPNPDRYKYPYANPYLNTCFSTITFLADKKAADFRYYMKQGKLAEFLVESELVKNGTIAQEDEDEFILINGLKNTEEKNQKLGGNTIIINNNSSTPIQKNGINININKDGE